MEEQQPQEIKKSSALWDLVKFLFIALIIVVPIRLFVAQPFIVEGPSMQPTFETGDYLIVDELSYRLHDPQRGDVVILHNPADPSRFLIKRVIGLPGETLTSTDGTITVTSKQDPKGTKLNEPYVTQQDESHDSWTVTLNSDQYFVMGDNRAVSLDSRKLGPATRDMIVGRAFMRLLPLGEVSLLPGQYHS